MHLRPAWHALNRHHVWRWVLMIVFAGLIALLYTDLLYLVLFIMIGAASFLPSRVTSAFGFELLTLLTVAAGVGMGAFAGLFVGVTGAFLGAFVRGNVEPSVIISMIEFGFIGIGASLASPQTFVIYGIIATLVYDIILVAAYTLLLGKDYIKSAMYFLTHLLINALLFLRLKTFVLGLL